MPFMKQIWVSGWPSAGHLLSLIILPCSMRTFRIFQAEDGKLKRVTTVIAKVHCPFKVSIWAFYLWGQLSRNCPPRSKPTIQATIQATI